MKDGSCSGRRNKAYPREVSNPYAPPLHDDDQGPPTASIGLRVAARLLDALCGMALFFCLFYVPIVWFDVDIPPQAAVLAAVPVLLVRSLIGQSPGERLCGIKRVRIDGKRRWIVVR